MSIEALLERIAKAAESLVEIRALKHELENPPSVIKHDDRVFVALGGLSSNTGELLGDGSAATFIGTTYVFVDGEPVVCPFPHFVYYRVQLYAEISETELYADIRGTAAAPPMPEGQAQVLAGLLGNAESGTALGAMSAQAPAPAPAPAAKRGPGRPRKADPAPDAAPGGQPQAEAPKQQAEAPKQQAEAVKPQIQVRADATKPQVQPAPEPQAAQPHLMDVARKGDIPLSPTLPADGNIDVSTLRLRLSRLSSLGLRARLEDMFARFGITVLSQLNAAEYPRMWAELDTLQAEYEDGLRQQGGFTR